MISVRFTMPATSRDRQALGVISIDALRMASGMPGVRRSHTSHVASGVMSRGEKPVPPVVTTSATLSATAACKAATISACSSGTSTTCSSTAKPFSPNQGGVDYSSTSRSSMLKLRSLPAIGWLVSKTIVVPSLETTVAITGYPSGVPRVTC